jgi:hypothetical protein
MPLGAVPASVAIDIVTAPSEPGKEVKSLAGLLNILS